MKNTPEGMLLLEKLKAKPTISVKVTFLHECFSRFLNCTNGTKLRQASQIKTKYQNFFEKDNGRNAFKKENRKTITLVCCIWTSYALTF